MAGHVVFRVDASTEIGTGHVMRCLTLAEALRERGADAHFVSREHEGNLCALVEERGFPMHRLAMGATANGESDPAHAGWLGAHWQDDAEDTRAAIEACGVKPDWLIVDHYALDARWESRLRGAACAIMAIDDLADRDHDCDLLLDQNMIEGQEERYEGRVPEGCTLLLGPAYALLQPDYARLHEKASPRRGPVRRVLIYFGGVDRDDLTIRTVDALLSLGRPGIEADIVLSPRSSQFERVQERVAGHSGLRLHARVPSLAPLMAAADLAIGAGGATSWERLCLGLPALVVTIAQNQRPIAAELHKQGLVRWLGHIGSISGDDIRNALEEILASGLDGSWSTDCLKVVDGEGTRRVSAAMARIDHLPLVLRHAGPGDEKLLLDWANDAETRRNAFSSKPISSEEHHRWFQSRLGMRESCAFYIAETRSGVPCGQVRFERRDEEWEITYAVARSYRGLGLGAAVLGAAIDRFDAETGAADLVAQVKTANIASQKIFDALGFSTRSADRDRHIYERLRRHRETATVGPNE